MTDKLPFVAGLLTIAALTGAAFAIEEGWTTRVTATLILAIGLAVLLGVTVAVTARGGRARDHHEARWQANREGPWADHTDQPTAQQTGHQAKHRAEGDPR